MEEQVISYEVAKLAKEKGFYMNSITYYQEYKTGQLRYKYISEEDSTTSVSFDPETRVAACTQSVLQRWFREKKHHLSVCIDFRHVEGKMIEGLNLAYYNINIYWLNGTNAWKKNINSESIAQIMRNV